MVVCFVAHKSHNRSRTGLKCILRSSDGITRVVCCTIGINIEMLWDLLLSNAALHLRKTSSNGLYYRISNAIQIHKCVPMNDDDR